MGKIFVPACVTFALVAAASSFFLPKPPAPWKAPADQVCDAIERTVRRLLPFSEGRVERVSDAPPRWDLDGWLGSAGASRWPGECEIRRHPRGQGYALDRTPLGGLGFEGDILLGWRAGDEIAADLS